MIDPTWLSFIQRHTVYEGKAVQGAGNAKSGWYFGIRELGAHVPASLLTGLRSWASSLTALSFFHLYKGFLSSRLWGSPTS